MTLQARLEALATAVGNDIKNVSGKLELVGASPPTLINQEGWHTVGAAGEPAFQNGWGHHDINAYAVKFRKRPDGVVQIRGMARGGASATTIFTLPVGYRPDEELIVPTLVDWNAATVPYFVSVKPTGVVTVTFGAGSTNVWVSMAEIEFDTGQLTFPASITAVPQEGWRQVGAAGEPPFTNNWTHFDSAAGRIARFRKDAAGIVHLDGIIKLGTTDTPAFTLPVGYRPTQRSVWAQRGTPANNNTLVQIDPDGTVTPYNTGAAATGYIYLTGITLDTGQTTFPAGKAVIPVVTALPAVANEGDEIILSTGTRRWRLRFEQATQRWYPEGAATPLHSGPGGAISFNSTTPTVPGGGPSLTVPVKGRYLLRLGAYLEAPTSSGIILQAQGYKNGAFITAGALLTVKGSGAKTFTEGEQDFVVNDFLDFRIFGNTPTTAYYGDNFHLSLQPIYLSL